MAETNPRATPFEQESAASRWSFVTTMAAGLCWTGVLALLFLANLHIETDPLAPQRLLFYTLVVTAGILTFTPVQYAMNLPHLAFEGVTSTSVLLYTLAFVPPPTNWLLYLPDLPVYVLFIAALFWSSASLVQPFVYAAGQRIFKQRARRLDVHRARRQSYEIGTLAAAVAVLAGLQALNWISLLLLVLILIMTELLLLARIKVKVRRR